uniref:Uncharacterized protein n=1 Tax=Tolypothrix bouteillei VB521301 TaxID=1479485 RepID=A0A0C1NLU9_9CYAN
MQDRLISISPNIINDAIFNICARYKVIKYNEYIQDSDISIDGYANANLGLDCVSRLKKMRNLTISINANSSGVSTWEEYSKTLEEVIWSFINLLLFHIDCSL